MFSLVIVLISIALVVALVLATIYYGGKTADRAATRNAASTVVNQSAQIAAAGVLAVAQGPGWPSANPHFSEPYLKAMPVPPRAAYADPEETPLPTHWTYYVEPNGTTHHFVLKNKLSREVCLAVNREQGVIGIPAVWDGSTLIQCFGPGVAERAGAPKGYTFFYDPVSSTSAQKAAALEQSKTEGGSATPGYPRSCPDGTSIDSGLCPDVDGTGSTSEPGGPGAGGSGAGGSGTYALAAVPGILTVDGLNGGGSNYSSYCSSDMPSALVTEGASLTIGGMPASIDYIYQSGGAICVDSYGNPSHSAGSYPVVLTTAEGSTATGTISYVETLAQPPLVSDMSPRLGPANTSTLVTITGEGFAPGIKVYLEYAKELPVTYVSSTQIQVTIPASTSVGYPSDQNTGAAVIIVNPDSDYAFELFDYVAVDEPGSGGGGESGGTEDPSGWTFVPGMTTQVLVTGIGAAYYDESGVQQGNFATYRAVKDCSSYPGVGEATYGGSFCIPALKAEYREWDGHTAGYVSTENGGYHQFGYVLSDGENTYTFLTHYSDGDTPPGMQMFVGTVSGPLGTPPSVPWSPDYGCSGYCNGPRND